MKDVKVLLSDLHPDVAELFESARTHADLIAMVKTIAFLRKKFPGIARLTGNPESASDLPSTAVIATVPAVGEPERTYNVVLGTGGGENKINVIRAVREITYHGLKQAKDMVDDADAGKHVVIKAKTTKEEALAIQGRIESLGGTVTIE